MADVDVGVAAPVVPASTDAPAPVSTADSVVESADKPESKPERTFTQKEVNEIAARRAAQAERSALKIARAEARAEVAERQLQDRARPSSEASGEPQSNDPKFKGDYEKFLIAKAKYEFKQDQAAEREASERTTNTQQQQRDFAQRAEQTRNAMSKAAEKYVDFEEVITGNVPFTEPMAAYIAEAAKDGGELAYYLGTHIDEAKRISQLPPARQIVELHALETKMTAPPKPTNTPAPIVPNGSASAGNKKDWKEMSTEEHIKAYRAQKKRS